MQADIQQENYAGTESGASKALTVFNPRTGDVASKVTVASEEEVSRAIGAASAAWKDWKSTPAAARGTMLHKAADALAAAAESLAETNAAETGRPVAEARAGIEAGIGTLRQYAELGPLHRGHSLRGGALASDYTVPEARGVAAVLTPWNDPVAVACGLIGAALVTGNTVVHKPSERCPQLGVELGDVLAPVFPGGVFSTVSGGPEVGMLLTQDFSVAVIAHVGSSDAGARIARAGMLTGAHVIRENGGNDPLVVDADVDPRWAAEQAAIGAFSNSGQICTAVERIYVHRDIAETFCEALADEARRRNEDGSLAPLVDTRMRDAVEAQVVEALARGARALAGGSVPDGPGAYYPATVLTDCADTMDIMLQETFGPVAPVRVVESFEEGLSLAASGDYGLAATVLTAGLEHAQHAIAALPVGTVKINAVFGGAPGGSAQPRGISGQGFGYGPELLDEFTRVKVVHLASPPAASPQQVQGGAR